jgi:hypothetical protein
MSALKTKPPAVGVTAASTGAGVSKRQRTSPLSASVPAAGVERVRGPGRAARDRDVRGVLPRRRRDTLHLRVRLLAVLSYGTTEKETFAIDAATCDETWRVAEQAPDERHEVGFPDLLAGGGVERVHAPELLPDLPPVEPICSAGDDAFDVEPVLGMAGEHLEDDEILGAAGDDRFTAADRVVAGSLDRPLLERHRGQSDVDRHAARALHQEHPMAQANSLESPRRGANPERSSSTIGRS